MSNSHNWKKLGANSGNMYTHRNMKTHKLNYKIGKWEDVNNADGKKIGISHCIPNSETNENMLVGIGTKEPFSRLSLGSNTNDGKSNGTSGQLASIALHENSDGTDFHGLSYVTDISSALQDGNGKTNALALYSNRNDQQINSETAYVYITDENITNIGGKPRRTFDDWDNQPVVSDNNGVPIKLDCHGSINVSGFISFMDKTNSEDSKRDNPANASADINDPNSTRNIPVGSIWAGYTEGKTNVALYIQDLSGKRQIIGTGSGGGGGQSDISGILWDGSQNNTFEESWIGKGGSNITFTPSTDSTIIGGPSLEPNTRPPNAITITQGNLSVVGKDNYSKKVTNDDTNIPSTSFGLSSDDTVGGIIWAERQIAIGIKGDVIDVKPKALLDISGNVARVPSIIINTNSNINSATDSVIISNNNSKTIGGYEGNDNNTAKSSIIIGDNNVWASDKSIILGTDNTIGNGNNLSIIDCGKNIIVLGQNNKAINEINTCIIGKQNTVDSSGNTNSKGNLIFGTSNTYYSKSATNKNENNLIMGDTNSLIDSEYSIISGNNNDTSGKNNLVIGKENKIGFGDEITTQTTTKKANNSYILGNTNKIKANDSTAVTNTYMFGNNNECDATDTSFIDNVDSSTIIFGSYGKINWTSDVSNQRFIFSTQEKHEADGGGTNNGHVFTIDKSGNTVIEGDLTVRGNKSITDLCGNDASFNNVFILQDLSGNDASFNNVDILQDLCGNDASFNNVDVVDLCGNDASFNNVDVVDLCGNDASFNNVYILEDLCGNDASFNNVYILEDLCGNDASFNNVDVVDLCGNDASFNNVDIDNILKTNTINNNGDSNITIENIRNDKDIIFKTKKSGASTIAITIDGSAKETLFYGGYNDTSGVTIDANGNLKMTGKLTVDGLIDPTGLVLTKQSSNPNSSDSSTDHLTLFFDQTSGGLQYVTRDDSGNVESKVIATGSSGDDSGGGTAIEGNAETASNLKKGTSRGVLHQTADKETSILGYGSSGKFLKSTGSAPTWSDLPTAGDNSVGGIKTGYSNTGDDKNYAVQLSEGKAYVNVPWEDTNNTYEVMGSGNQYADGLVPAGSADGTGFLKQDGTWATPTDTNNTYDIMGSGNQYADGLVPAGSADGTGFLKQDGTWATPTDTNTVYTAGTGITISNGNVISLSDPGQTAAVTIVDTGDTERTLDFRNGLLVSGLASGTTTGDITFGGTTLKFTNGFLTSKT